VDFYIPQHNPFFFQDLQFQWGEIKNRIPLKEGNLAPKIPTNRSLASLIREHYCAHRFSLFFRFTNSFNTKKKQVYRDPKPCQSPRPNKLKSREKNIGTRPADDENTAPAIVIDGGDGPHSTTTRTASGTFVRTQI